MKHQVRVIGNKGCSRCTITKHILEKEGIPHEYVVLADLKTEEQKTILTKAKDNGILTLPIIEFDGELKSDVQEVLELCK